jgi:hypothetical protein
MKKVEKKASGNIPHSRGESPEASFLLRVLVA